MNCPNFSPRTWAEVSRTSLLHNYRLLCTDARGVRLCCVVKADAYGHGAPFAVRTLKNAGADHFAVSSVEEAAEVRGVLGERQTPVLILGYTRPEYAPYLIEENISQALISEEYANALCTHIPAGKRLSVHIALDSGMNRIGFCPEKTDSLLRVFAQPAFCVDGIFSHFMLADEPSSDVTAAQYARVRTALDALRAAGIGLPSVHVCNSAALSHFPDYHCDMVRAGISLYGLQPSEQAPVEGLIPVMTVKTTLAHIHTVRAGEAIGYGASYRAERDMRVGTLTVGYGDGYRRSYAGGDVLLRGKRAPLLGRICMDQCMIDLSGIPEAAVGDPVTLFGADTVTAEELAHRAGTIHYEVVCAVSGRVPRVETE